MISNYSTPHVRRWRSLNPMRYAYLNLKHNARRRGKEFKLTFEQFAQFCRKVDYLKKKGVSASSYHIDRIDENKGYTLDNIQVLTNSANVRKYLDYRWNELNGNMDFKTVTAKPVQQNECPF